MRKGTVETTEPTITAERRTALDVAEKFIDATGDIERLSNLIQLLVENYNLDMLSLTENQQQDLVNGHRIIGSTLSLIQNRLWDMQEKIEAINNSI